mmetsp:Transcript_2086/g.4873  ORF Transcript_2086/g.4873 Transcript_2086/m.4873 type:complete len:220 (+) Transcript_2086:697-1356(+)
MSEIGKRPGPQLWVIVAILLAGLNHMVKFLVIHMVGNVLVVDTECFVQHQDSLGKVRGLAEHQSVTLVVVGRVLLEQIERLVTSRSHLVTVLGLCSRIAKNCVYGRSGKRFLEFSLSGAPGIVCIGRVRVRAACRVRVRAVDLVAQVQLQQSVVDSGRSLVLVARAHELEEALEPVVLAGVQGNEGLGSSTLLLSALEAARRVERTHLESRGNRLLLQH